MIEFPDAVFIEFLPNNLSTLTFSERIVCSLKSVFINCFIKLKIIVLNLFLSRNQDFSVMHNGE